ncbi:MAG: hypothetical protein M5T52_06660 [Ignavibacteriaceae bacterium]|nr:hypothetical protein [Ignavibacteriaceae bacterium]
MRGKNKTERLENYFEDMRTVCVEIARVLKPDKYAVIIIGSNTNQTGGIQLEDKIINFCERANLKLVKSIVKPIKGLRNTMKDEYVLFLKKLFKRHLMKSTDEKFKKVIDKNTFYFYNKEFEESYEGYVNSIKELLLNLKNEIELNGLKKNSLKN